jgi:hypothetical protein
MAETKDFGGGGVTDSVTRGTFRFRTLVVLITQRGACCHASASGGFPFG